MSEESARKWREENAPNLGPLYEVTDEGKYKVGERLQRWNDKLVADFATYKIERMHPLVSEFLRKVASRHRYCEDSWYACPHNPEYCDPIKNPKLSDCDCDAKEALELLAQI